MAESSHLTDTAINTDTSPEIDDISAGQNEHDTKRNEFTFFRLS